MGPRPSLRYSAALAHENGAEHDHAEATDRDANSPPRVFGSIDRHGFRVRRGRRNVHDFADRRDGPQTAADLIELDARISQRSRSDATNHPDRPLREAVITGP